MTMDVAAIVGHITLLLTTIAGFVYSWHREKRRHAWHKEELAKLHIQIGQNGDSGK